VHCECVIQIDSAQACTDGSDTTRRRLAVSACSRSEQASFLARAARAFAHMSGAGLPDAAEIVGSDHRLMAAAFISNARRVTYGKPRGRRRQRLLAGSWMRPVPSL